MRYAWHPTATEPRDEPETHEQSLARWNRVMGLSPAQPECRRCGCSVEFAGDLCALCEAEEES